MTTRWRLIEDEPTDGALNMGVDRALLVNTGNSNDTPTLRLYSWRSETLSIGYAQSLDKLDLAYLAQENIPIVRRPTGGRALLHNDEVTYAIIIPATSRHYGSLAEIYQFTSRIIIDALASVGIAVDQGAERSNKLRHTPCCFSTMTRHEIAVDGKKIVGSAQRRLKSGALQHGSIVLTQNAERYLSCFRWNDESKRSAVAKTIGSINNGKRRPISAEDLYPALIRSFNSVGGLEFYRDTLTSDEAELALGYGAEAMALPEFKGLAVL